MLRTHKRLRLDEAKKKKEKLITTFIFFQKPKSHVCSFVCGRTVVRLFRTVFVSVRKTKGGCRTGWRDWRELVDENVHLCSVFCFFFKRWLQWLWFLNICVCLWCWSFCCAASYRPNYDRHQFFWVLIHFSLFFVRLALPRVFSPPGPARRRRARAPWQMETKPTLCGSAAPF